jgi:hypothetical protein
MMTIQALTGKLTEAHINVRKPRLKGRAHSRERSIRRGTTKIDAFIRNEVVGIFIESRGGTRRIPGK